MNYNLLLCQCCRQWTFSHYSFLPFVGPCSLLQRLFQWRISAFKTERKCRWAACSARLGIFIRRTNKFHWCLGIGKGSTTFFQQTCLTSLLGGFSTCLTSFGSNFTRLKLLINCRGLRAVQQIPCLYCLTHWLILTPTLALNSLLC